ncbi:uncharacterized protein BX663DRAFT_74781 [Cokeromyces recurvatus]|uniref:uncharacterized protein n=1 Tax=Cokeromyces recurvatus TaxID=90255 RepID=UPI002220ACF9|nr:uncharacterized protein BX663DRAFT_74781 [Cokeromyces recurvatus]KAI7902408.1 hypothetical protein BX663DRAFT_74781 [Cokeromyces recurvatus]
MSVLTKELINNIRKVPENKNKSESSQALMNNLRSKSHLYNVIQTIRVVTFGPDTIVNLMLQQRIPSIIIKLFRSFIDLNSSYYKEEYEAELASIDDTVEIITDILKQFVQNQTVLHRLIIEDTLFMIMRIMTAKPIIQQDNDNTYIYWKKRITEVLKVIDMNSEVCQYIHHRRCCIDLLIRSWREKLSKGYLTSVDHQDILMDFDVIYYQLYKSAKIQFFGLFEEMIHASGYEVLCKILKTGPFNESITHEKIDIMNKIASLSFVGKISPIPSISDGLPYQHEDFSTPQPQGHTGNAQHEINNLKL